MKKKKLPRKFISKPKVIEAKEVKKSPSISRSIPEIHFPAITLVPAKELMVGFVCGCLVVGIVFSSMRLLEKLNEYQRVLQEKKVFVQQKTYWESVTRQFPLYRDAHFRLGVLSYQEGKVNEANTEIAKALQIDPTFTEARLLAERIRR